jgi:hypothetical protein
MSAQGLGYADVRKADQLELADDLLDRHLGALSPSVSGADGATARAVTI